MEGYCILFLLAVFAQPVDYNLIVYNILYAGTVKTSRDYIIIPSDLVTGSKQTH